MYDQANLKKVGHLKSLAPATMAAFEAFDRAAMSGGIIPRRYKELMALAVAIATQCPYSIEVHRANAVSAGCSDGEISEAVFVAATMRATAALAHGTHALGPPTKK